ncbi:ATP-binding protein [Caballeronia sp. CLC5]|uniref:ATP-binding protein n=2 Tax=unclassified Caballeronia TaxID=2646786 RepID=UPI001F47158E|nr:ATP-binding protein [Caballeronia sp. CLC5]MCE4570195.1 ATP-binding protein [Caballeronia sp. CLC5]
MTDTDQTGRSLERAAENVSFRTRARTIDHLGRGQIADAPTAVSELWKNAWDAYATQVSLNIFDGDPAVAAVFDDGIGMSAQDFVEKWLVIGTESKIDGPPPAPPADFTGSARERQGEKGIGRLSAAFLAPATLVLSQQADGPISAVLVDWRLFENPFLSLDQITLPVRTFGKRGEVAVGLRAMATAILDNLGERSATGDLILSPDWQRYTAAEQAAGARSTAEAMIDFWSEMPISARHLEEWPVFADLASHGTALYLLGAHHELSVWLGSAPDDDEAKEVKQRLKDILTGFTDTLSAAPVVFDYEVLAYHGDVPRRILASSDVFDLSDFRELEHSVEGAFDEAGVFRGKIRAFGEDLGERIIPPPRSLPPARSDRPGPFAFAIGTFEQVAMASTHNAKRHQDLMELVDRYGGVRVYRDGLRVMPYGSADADFFSLEETRQKHAGRYFWAHRRSFGRLAFTRAGNPALKDKAGREGLVENRASRELRLLVQALLIKLARDYFGTDSPEREERIAETKKRNIKGRKAAEQARKRRRGEFRTYLADAIKRMPQLAERAKSISSRLEDVKQPASKDTVAMMRAEVELARAELAALTPLDVPNTLGDAESRYRTFRDELDEASDLILLSDQALREMEATVGASSPREVAAAARDRHEKALNELLSGFQGDIREGIKAITSNWTSNLEDDRTRYERATTPLLRKLSQDTDLNDLLGLLETVRRELEDEFNDRYRPIVRNIRTIIEGVDAEMALATIDEDREELDRRVRDLNAVAQLGITVEIIGHELEALDSEVSRNLEKLPDTAKKTLAFTRAMDAHRSLTEKLRFLSPLQLAGARLRETITGKAIVDYVRDFFGPVFTDGGIRREYASFRLDPLHRTQITHLPGVHQPREQRRLLGRTVGRASDPLRFCRWQDRCR